VTAAVDLGRAALRSSAFRFLVVGGLSVVVDTGLLYLLHGRLGLWLPPATALAFLAGFGVNFSLNRQWSFNATGAVRAQIGRYLVLVAANLALTIGLVQVLTWLSVPYLVAKVATTAALSAANYVISKRWIFI
jgi:putative flippase GtrA